MDSKKILAKLRKFGKEVKKDIPSINNGGCGVYAYMMGEALIKHGIKNVECFNEQYFLVHSTDKYREIGESNRNKKISMYDWEDLGVEFEHIGVKFELDGVVYFHDVEQTKKNVVNNFAYGEVTHCYFDVSTIKHIASKPEGWSQVFSRRKNIPKLKKKFKEFAL